MTLFKLPTPCVQFLIIVFVSKHKFTNDLSVIAFMTDLHYTDSFHDPWFNFSGGYYYERGKTGIDLVGFRPFIASRSADSSPHRTYVVLKRKNLIYSLYPEYKLIEKSEVKLALDHISYIKVHVLSDVYLIIYLEIYHSGNRYFTQETLASMRPILCNVNCPQAHILPIITCI